MRNLAYYKGCLIDLRIAAANQQGSHKHELLVAIRFVTRRIKTIETKVLRKVS